ncbi:helix-turn-helix transcriptional regulator [Jatrophihabitans sp. YIM 134969]
MPTSSAPTTSGRLLSLLSLLQVRRDWPGSLLAERLDVSARTVRRDVDRLRELGYPVTALRGPDGGYRLDAGAHLPPLLFDDDQAVALALALRGAPALGAGIDEAAARALATLGAVMPTRLRARLDALAPTVVGHEASDDAVRPATLLTISAAIRDREELRFDYRSPGREADTHAPPRQVQPHHLVARRGHWFVVGWATARDDWRTFRVDRMRLRVPNGPRFRLREVPGGDVATFVAARSKGSDTVDRWPCRGSVLVHLPATDVAPFAGDGTVTAVAADRCRLDLGSWSWAGLAASLARFDAELEVEGPDELRRAFADLATRAARAAR